MRKKRRNKQKRGIHFSFPRPQLDPSGIVYWLGAILIGLAIIFIAFMPWPILKQVECVSQNHSCPSDIEQILVASLSEQNILSLNQEIIQSIINQRYSTLEVTTIQFQLPFTVMVTIRARPPAAIIKSPTQTIIVDENAHRMQVDKIDVLDVPIIESVLAYPSNGTINDSTTIFALELVESLQKRDIPITAISILDISKVIVQLTDQRQIIFSSNTNLTRQVTTLQLILNAATISNELPVIDLRFDKPILKPQLES